MADEGQIKTEESEPEAEPEPEPEPLAKTRTRRSNAGARMHEMIFNADDEELFNQTYSGLLKADDDSSEDEEYVPKDIGASGGANADDGADDDHSEGTSDSNLDSEDEEDSDEEDEDEEDEEEQQKQNDEDKSERINVKLELKSEPSSTTIAPGSPKKAAYEACRRICSVCLGEQSDEDDEIIECDSCGVSVHESCYGVSGEDNSHVDHHDDSNKDQDNCNNNKDADKTSVYSNISSESTEPWFCEPCKRSVKNPLCEICPNTGGIFKQTDTGRWIHMVCALYTRGVTFENIDTLSGVSLFELNYASYASKACTICEDRRLARSGVCIGCDAGLCKTFFHVTCAQKEGLLFESHSDEVDPYFAQCKQHADKTIIRKKKRTCMALFARLKRVQPLENCSERIKKKLIEINEEFNLNLTRWTPDNRPPIPVKVSRGLLTSPSLIMRLTKKSELMGLDTSSAFMNVQDEIETARQKWHIPPSFNLEFVAYCRDRTSRIVLMKKQNTELVKQNITLKNEEASLREKFNSLQELVSRLKIESEQLIKEARAIQKTVSTNTGKHFNLSIQMEQLIARCTNPKGKPHIKSSKKPDTTSNSILLTNNKTSSTYGCGKCGTVKDQHLLALCDTCHQYIHIYCLDPPLTRVPKKNKFGGWQCSDCSEKEEEDQEEALEEQNTLAVQEAAQDGPRRLRERIKFPDKYCHESMLMADFWSSAPKRKSKKSSKGASKANKRPKVE